MPQRFRMGNPHTDREIDALWREIRRAQQRVQTAEVQVAAAAAPEPDDQPPADDFTDTQVLIEGGPCFWPTRCYILPVSPFNETALTSQFTHPAQWVVWNDYKQDLYRTIVLDLHGLHPFYGSSGATKTWREQTGSPTPWQSIWQETVGSDSYEVARTHLNHRDSYVTLFGDAGALWVRAFCFRQRRWTGLLNGAHVGSIAISQQFEIRTDTDNPIPLTCADIPAAINISVDPSPWAHRLVVTFLPPWASSVSVTGLIAGLYIPETAIGAAA